MPATVSAMKAAFGSNPVYFVVWVGTVALAFSAGRWIAPDEIDRSSSVDVSSGRSAEGTALIESAGSDSLQSSGMSEDEIPARQAELRENVPALRRIADGSMDAGVWASAVREAAVLSYREAVDWFGVVSRLPSGQRRDGLLATLLGRISSRDPEGAMGLIGTIGSVNVRENARREVLRFWAGRDSSSALEWVEANREVVPGRLRLARMEAWMEGYARAAPAAAFQYAVDLPEGTRDELYRKRRLVETVVEERVAAGQVGEALQGLEQLPPGAVRDEAFSEFYSEWAKESPAAAGGHFLRNRRDGGERAAAGLVRTWAETDPVEAADFVASLGAEDPAFEVAVSSLIERWSRYDLEGPGQWLNELPPSEEIDRAVAVFSMRASGEDPAGAMTWAESISSESTRTRVMSGVAGNWKETDPAGFEAYLESSGLDEETADQLRRASGRRGRWFR